MATKICQGVFAINKPKSISSAQVLRELQAVFNPSQLFAPWIEAQTAERAMAARMDRNQRKRRHKKVEVKMGHGGTLDPMATGVLIVGVGKGTKHLQSFLECTKTYEAMVLFGAATDTYDILGKVLAKAPYAHLTEEGVRSALQNFRGKVMQRPPLYSALRVQGKRLYEYAREGKEVPVEIQERPVEVKELELVEWLNGDEHTYEWRAEEAGREDKELAEKVLNLSQVATTDLAIAQHSDAGEESGRTRKRLRDQDDELVRDVPASKRVAPNPKYSMSGALPCPAESTSLESTSLEITDERAMSKSPLGDANPSSKDVPKPEPITPLNEELQSSTNSSTSLPTISRPPAVKLHMTVTSGFYVRSLSHDLGKRVGSLGTMSELVRSRQGGFTLGKNVLEYEDLNKGEEVWAPKVERMLDEWERSLGEDDGGGGGWGKSLLVEM